MPKPKRVNRCPSPIELNQRAEDVRTENLLHMGATRRVGEEWGKGDAAWVRDADGEYFFGVLIEAPTDATGGARVMVKAKDGVWEVKIDQLNISRPKNAKESRVAPSPVPRKKSSPTVAATNGENGALCRCGCGERINPSRRFRPGHDARFHSRAKRLQAGVLSLEDLSEEMGSMDRAVHYYGDLTARSK